MIYLQSMIKFEHPNQHLVLAESKTVDRGYSQQQNDCWRLSNQRLNNLGVVHFYGDLPCNHLKFNKCFDFSSEIKQVNPRCWSIGKLHAASAQTEEFLHVDGDCFLSQPLPSRPFLVQGEENQFESSAWGWFYGFVSFCKKLGIHSGLIDEAVEQSHKNNGPKLYNFGIFGGTSSLLPSVCKEIVDFVLTHNDIWQKFPPFIFVTVVLEQLIIPLVMESRGVPVSTLFEIDNWNEDAKKLGYCHLVGQAKHQQSNVQAVRNRLKELSL
jgi:hypothetical protein